MIKISTIKTIHKQPIRFFMSLTKMPHDMMSHPCVKPCSQTNEVDIPVYVEHRSITEAHWKQRNKRKNYYVIEQREQEAQGPWRSA